MKNQYWKESLLPFLISSVQFIFQYFAASKYKFANVEWCGCDCICFT